MQSSISLSVGERAVSLGAVATIVEPCLTRTRCETVYELFCGDPDLFVLPVVDEAGRPVGLVGRHQFLLTFAAPYGRSLYARRPITSLMDASPLIVDAVVPLSVLSRRILGEKPTAVVQGFIVVRDGAYLGVGTGADVLRLSTETIRIQTAELIEAKQDADRANTAKSQFLATMSHELRTPLNAILGFAELIRDRVMGEDVPETYSDYAGHIHDSGAHLLELINDVLDIAKIESGKVETEREEFDLADYLRPVVEGFSAKAVKQELAFTARIPEAPLPCFADPRSVRQILTNLVGNAIKYTPKGGLVAVTVRELNANEVIIEVEDTGVGIAEKDQKRVFQPFEQVDNKYSRQSEGSGLGLALVRQLVDLNGGCLALRSVPGEGSCFSVTLGKRRAKAPARAAAAA
ncbi:hypothetical protein EOI86_12455 [Hwanghaeella grinnelliae]|uniref:histidine kinase n=1 Tax=Hwanghaeella grinnelliae TaxID=2500179 RepID=A0A437QNK0_9PROT|nr:ATP-binding protein [Hwanghaeella grinnelliae]RVU36045.1 hypothetical protein EOI86_12455 [Hwanghaeella grinnelliae]